MTPAMMYATPEARTEMVREIVRKVQDLDADALDQVLFVVDKLSDQAHVNDGPEHGRCAFCGRPRSLCGC